MSTPPPLAATGWSSWLSVAEHAAVREAGFSPRGLVMGSAVYKLGLSYSPNDYYAFNYGGGYGVGGAFGGGGPWGGGPWAGAPRGAYGQPGGGYRRAGSGSFPGWTKFYSASDLGYGGGWTGAPGMGLGGGGAWGGMMGPAAVCWERLVFEDGIEAAAGQAMGRILAETTALGAHGVIGTRLAFRYLEGLPSTIEFTAIGTAVVRPGADPLPTPFTSHLDGQALLKLLRAGMVPVAAAVGAGSVMAQMPRLGMGGTSMELGPYGDAIEAARRIAAERLQRAAGVHGWAVLGTLASSSTYGEGEGEVSTTVLTGTVVRRFATGSWDHLPLPIMRLSKP